MVLRWFTFVTRHLTLYLDNAVCGYLLICLAAAFLTTACFEEVLNGTEIKLAKSKFKHVTGYQLYVEAAYLVQTVTALAFIVGPILGGALAGQDGGMT